MKPNEINIDSIYQTRLNVEFRPGIIRPVKFFVRVTAKSSNGAIEIVLLHDPENIIHFLNPEQLDKVS